MVRFIYFILLIKILGDSAVHSIELATILLRCMAARARARAHHTVLAVPQLYSYMGLKCSEYCPDWAMHGKLDRLDADTVAIVGLLTNG